MTNNKYIKIISFFSFFILAINLAYAVTGLARYGSQHIDAYGIWKLKAIAIKMEGGIPLQLLNDPDYSYSHQTYPLLLPLWLSLGEWTWWSYPVVYSVILFLLYRILVNEGRSPTTALLWTTAASFMGPLIAQGGRLHAGLADIWITGLVAMGVWATQKQKPGLIVMAVMIASQIKMEGILLLAFLWFYPASWKQKGWWMGVAMLPFLAWQWWVRQWGIDSDIQFLWPGVVGIVERLGMVGVGIGREMINWRNWYVVWGIWVVNLLFSMIRKLQYSLPSLMGSGCVLNLLKSWKNLHMCASFAGISGRWDRVLLLMVMGYVGAYVLADLDTAAYIASSVDRIMLQLLPLWWIGLMGRKTKNML